MALFHLFAVTGFEQDNLVALQNTPNPLHFHTETLCNEMNYT